MNSIQYLRAVAAYLVVIFHISAILNVRGGDVAVFESGAIGVDIFFVLSGFLMAMIVSQRREVDGQFLLRRLIRIAPLYYLLTCALFVVAALAPEFLISDRLNFVQLFASFLFIPYPAADGSVTPILSLGWTLNYEMFFYCLIALTTKLFEDRKLQVTVMLIVGLVALGRVYDFGVFWQFYTDPILLEFAAGVLLFHYGFAHRQQRKSSVPGFLLIGGIVLIVAQPDFGHDAHRFFSMGLPAIFVVAGGILTLNFKARWLKRLGDWSYSTYLIHTFIIHLAVLGLGTLGDINPLMLIMIALPATILASALLYHLFEIPVIRELRWVCNIYYEPREMRAAGTNR